MFVKNVQKIFKYVNLEYLKNVNNYNRKFINNLISSSTTNKSFVTANKNAYINPPIKRSSNKGRLNSNNKEIQEQETDNNLSVSLQFTGEFYPINTPKGNTQTKTSKKYNKNKNKDTLDLNIDINNNPLGFISLLEPLTDYNLMDNFKYSQYSNLNLSPIDPNTITTLQLANHFPLPLIVEQSENVYLKDINNNLYLDFYSLSVNLGHNNKHITKRLLTQMKHLHLDSRTLYNNILYLASESITHLFKYDKVLFFNDNKEALIKAVELVNKLNPGKKFMTFRGSSFENIVNEIEDAYLLKYNDLEEIEYIIENEKEEINSVLIEPIMFENGIEIPDFKYLTKIYDLCKKYNILFIVDESKTSLGRTGFLTYCESENIKPDILILGDNLTNNIYPISAILSNNKILDKVDKVLDNDLLSFNPFSAEIVNATISEYISLKLNTNAFLRGLELGVILSDLRSNRLVKEIRGRGLMFAIELCEETRFKAKDFQIWLLERGIIVQENRKSIIIYPPLNINSAEVVKAAEIIINVFRHAEVLNVFEQKHVVNFKIIDADQRLVSQLLQIRMQRYQNKPIRLEQEKEIQKNNNDQNKSNSASNTTDYVKADLNVEPKNHNKKNTSLFGNMNIYSGNSFYNRAISSMKKLDELNTIGKKENKTINRETDMTNVKNILANNYFVGNIEDNEEHYIPDRFSEEFTKVQIK